MSNTPATGAAPATGFSATRPVVQNNPAAGEPLPGTLGDFKLIREVGRGGMGVVYEAEQLSLRRRVALKVLPFGATMDPRQLARFQNEARAAASLHHEHIAPVYFVGSERGVHFYAMQFIEGLTLAEFIRRQRRGPSPVPPGPEPSTATEPPDQRTCVYQAPPAGTDATTATLHCALPAGHGADYFRAIAALGLQAAEALEHAHSLGVVHRDVKPGNLMLDAQGKLWVTDFGLARVGPDGGLTATGDLLGTLRYMSPEQALARHGLVDHRSDVYSLGVTLYELLTLRPAFEGQDRAEVLRKIAFEEPRAPRLLKRSIPADLETVVLKAMAKEPAERYASARDLADDLRRFLDDHPVRARRASLGQRLARWARRRRAVVLSAVAALFVAVIALAAGTALAWRAKARADRALASEKEAHGVAEEQRRLAQASAAEADAHLLKSLDAVDRMLARVATARLADMPHTQQVRRELLADALALYQDFLRVRADHPAVRREAGRAHHSVGYILHQLGRYPEAEKAYRQAIRLHEELAADFPDVPGHGRRLANSYNGLAGTLEVASRAREAERAYRKALALRKELVERSPERARYVHELADTHHNLGGLMQRTGRAREAEGPAREALRWREKALALAPSRAKYRQARAVSLNLLGIVLMQTGRRAEAEKVFREVIDIHTKLLADSPARPDYREELAQTQHNLGNVLRDAGRLAGAEKAYAEAVKLATRLVEDFPRLPAYRELLAASHGSLAPVLVTRGRFPRAVEALGEAVAHYRRLADDSPRVAAYRNELARCLTNRADLLEAGGRHEDAEKGYREAVSLWKDLSGKHPENPEYRADQARCFTNLGIVLMERRPREAQDAHTRALGLLRPLVEKFPDRPAYARSLGATLHNLAVVVGNEGRPGEARTLLEEAVRHQQSALKRQPDEPSSRRFLRNHYASLTQTLLDLGDHSAAARAAAGLSGAAAPGAWADHYSAARALAACVRLAEKDEHLPAARRRQGAREYARQAVRFLREAVRHGGKIADRLEKDEVFDPLRDRDDFRALLRRQA